MTSAGGGDARRWVGGRRVKQGRQLSGISCLVTPLGASKQTDDLKQTDRSGHVLRDSQEHGCRPARLGEWCRSPLLNARSTVYNFFGENKSGENGVARKHPSSSPSGRIESS